MRYLLTHWMPFKEDNLYEFLFNFSKLANINIKIVWTASSEFGTYRLCEQRRFRRDCASAQSHQNLRCSLIQAVSQEEASDRKPDPWPLWMAGHAQLKFVMTECSKTLIPLTRPSLLHICDTDKNRTYKVLRINNTHKRKRSLWSETYQTCRFRTRICPQTKLKLEL